MLINVEDTLFDENLANILQVSLTALEAVNAEGSSPSGNMSVNRSSQKVRDALHLNNFGISMMEGKARMMKCIFEFEKNQKTSCAAIGRFSSTRDLINSKIPPEILSLVLATLQSKDLYQVSLVCRSWYSVGNRVLWRAPDPKTQSSFDKMLMGMILGREAVRLRSMVNLQSHSPVFAQNPGEFIRAIHYKYWFKLPVAFGEMLIDYAKNIKVFPRIGFFSFMPSVSFFGKCMKQLKLEALVFDCLSPAYIDTVMGELSLTELRRLKIVNLDNETLDSTFTLTAKTLKKLESITVSFSQSFSDATLINIAKFTTGLKNISIDFAPGLTLQGFSTFWEELPQTVTRIVLEHVNLFSSTNKPVVLQRIQKNISELQIVRTSLPVEQLRQLALLVPNVTKLRLCDATVDDSVVQIFSRTCNKVEILCLNSSSSVTNSSLISIALHLKNLKVLSLDYLNLLTDGGVANFLGSDVGNRISSLSLYSCLGLSNSIVASICDEMNGKCLTALNLGAVSLITETGVIELLEAKGKLLSKLSISGIDVGIKVLESLSLYCSKRLQVLDVGKQKWIDRTSAEMLVKRLCGLRILYAEGFMDLTENDIWEGHSFCTENGSFCRLDSLGRLDLSGFSRAAKV